MVDKLCPPLQASLKIREKLCAAHCSLYEFGAPDPYIYLRVSWMNDHKIVQARFDN
jgi:hypothetical protein